MFKELKRSQCIHMGKNKFMQQNLNIVKSGKVAKTGRAERLDVKAIEKAQSL